MQLWCMSSHRCRLKWQHVINAHFNPSKCILVCMSFFSTPKIKCSIPVWVRLFPGRSLVISQERTARWKTPQVELGHVRQGDIDRSVVSEKTKHWERPSLKDDSRISASVSPLGLTCWNPRPWQMVYWSALLEQTSLMRTKKKLDWLTVSTTCTFACLLKGLLCCQLRFDL